MERLCSEISAFGRRRDEELGQARQTAALFLAAGLDLADALEASPVERTRLMVRLERLIERGRLRGMRRHWSYDLNRHISLKQVLERLRGLAEAPG